jgi:hypothetical protein
MMSGGDSQMPLKNPEVEFKGLIDDITRGFVQLFDTEAFKSRIRNFTNKHYDKGLLKGEAQVNMNFLRNTNNLEHLNNYSFTLVKDLTDDMSSALRKSLQEGLLNQESVSEIKGRVEAIFKGKGLKLTDKNGNVRSINWRDRMTAIVRTESVRAENYGHADAIEQSGITFKKYVSVHMDARTSPICMTEDLKYGTPDKAIPMSDDFVVSVKGKIYKTMLPPFHPNCRTRALFVEA